MEPLMLNCGIEMPRIGFGTWKMADGEEAYAAVTKALQAGYRLIDTAKYYGNEVSVGKAVRESGIPRSDIFVTTKLWPTDFLHPRKAFEKSLRLLDIGTIDLYLVHWPVPGMPKSIWKALEPLCEEKLVRSIGVSNYDVETLRHTLSYAKVIPAVNQIKFNPLHFNSDVLEFCKQNDIVVEAYSPLDRGSLSDETITQVAKKHGKTNAQVMLRWCVQHGTVPLPKSVHPERMRENLAVFDWQLDEEDMESLNSLTT
ncbi:MAG TPA: aldo/keto reductase [Candidatus Paceibacterota bacterium]|nr:aldo/keto reductase [Candidatus Paceibacterota bacterium]